MATNQRKREAKGKFPQSAGVNSPPLAGRSALPKENLRVLVSGFNEKQSITAVGVAVFLPAEVSAQAGKDGKVLLGKRKGSHGVGEYAFPGGKLEYLESFGECARREVREECGIEIKNIRFQFVANLLAYKPKHFTHIGLVADWESGEAKVLEPEKCESWDWYETSKLPAPLFFVTDLFFDSLKTGKNYYDFSL